MGNIITAIDLGTTKVVCISGEQTLQGVRVLAACEAPSQGVRRGEVLNNQAVLNALQPLIQEVQTQTGQKIKDVIVGIAGQHVRCQSECNMITRPDEKEEITLDEITRMQQNMFTARVNPGEEILHVVAQSYHVDEHMGIQDPVGMYGKKIEANYRLFVGRTNSAEHSKRCIEKAGLHLTRLVLEPLASAKAVLKDDEKELGVAMIDIGGGTTDLLIYHDNLVRHTAVIPFGGNVISEDIRQGCEVTLRQAEQMKKQYGSCYSDLAPDNKTIIIPGIGGKEPREISFKTLANIIEARMDEIMEAIMFEIDRSGYINKLPAGIVLTGGGSLLSHLPQYIKYKTGFDTRIARPAYIDSTSCREVNNVGYSCAVGLLMKGFEYLTEGAALADSIERRNPVLESVPEPTEKSPKIRYGRFRKSNKTKGIASLFDNINGFFSDTDNKA